MSARDEAGRHGVLVRNTRHRHGTTRVGDPAAPAARCPRGHDLRHTDAVPAAATGATLAELMARLGHSTRAAALRYQHAAQGRDVEIAKALSALVQRPR